MIQQLIMQRMASMQRGSSQPRTRQLPAPPRGRRHHLFVAIKDAERKPKQRPQAR
jgi:hypothetical protein